MREMQHFINNHVCASLTIHIVPFTKSCLSHRGGKYSARKKRQTGTILVCLFCLLMIYLLFYSIFIINNIIIKLQTFRLVINLNCLK